jgi:hypothetical protein
MWQRNHTRTIAVRDQLGGRVEGATVEFIGGHNAGRAALSNELGTARFFEIICGPATVRATKPGYRDSVLSATLCGKGGNGQPGSESIGPFLLIPIS